MKLIKLLFKLLAGLGLLVVAILILAAVKGNALDKESRAYIRETLPVLADGWKVDEFSSRVSDELAQEMVKRGYDAVRFCSTLRPLGDLQRIDDLKGDSNVLYTFPFSLRMTADYTAQVAFDSGAARVDMSLIKRDGRWQLLGFFVHAEALRQPAPAAASI